MNDYKWDKGGVHINIIQTWISEKEEEELKCGNEINK